jgi:hypothetical protein
MIAFGAWCLFVGLAGLVSRQLWPEPGRRSKAMTEAIMRTLRRYHMVASDEYYDTLSRIMIPGIIGVGAVFVIVGIIRQ